MYTLVKVYEAATKSMSTKLSSTKLHRRSRVTFGRYLSLRSYYEVGGYEARFYEVCDEVEVLSCDDVDMRSRCEVEVYQ